MVMMYHWHRIVVVPALTALCHFAEPTVCRKTIAAIMLKLSSVADLNTAHKGESKREVVEGRRGPPHPHLQMLSLDHTVMW